MIKVITDYPIAYDSPDHIHPHGTKKDNSTDLNFVEEVSNFFYNNKINFLDLGCSGGQLVVDFFNKGNFSIGLEGSDYSLVNQRANWPEYGNILLYTADVTKPYTITYDDTVVLFDMVTAWEVVEHIKLEDLPNFFQNISNVLKDGGFFVASIAMHEDGLLHQIVKNREEWMTEIFPIVLKDTGLNLMNYPFKHWVRGGSQSFHIMLQKQINNE